MPSDELLNVMILIRRSCKRTVSNSPSSMPRPPSPDMEITWRSRSARCAPIACGRALAMLPCRNEPITRRRPFGVSTTSGSAVLGWHERGLFGDELARAGGAVGLHVRHVTGQHEHRHLTAGKRMLDRDAQHRGICDEWLEALADDPVDPRGLQAYLDEIARRRWVAASGGLPDV
jgi:hypothetical protein